MSTGFERLPREYRMSRSRMVTVLTVLVTANLGLAKGLLELDGLPTSFTYPFLVAWAGLMGWIFYTTLRSSTTADLEAIHVHGVFKQRRLAWEDIQDIRAEGNPVAARREHAPKVLVYAYGRDGRRMLLPFLDNLHVNVGREVGALLEAWEELRGDDWAPSPEAAVRIDRRDTLRRALLSGVSTALLAFIPLTVLMLLPLFVDLPGWLAPVLRPLVVVVAGPPLVFAVAATASYRKETRDR
ncbi:PH domain-containing protein [Streptomyces sp. NPDC127038]|uniref:PH domain-containing protein n=1 Tax=Streptomyces sp. NPDC127038 TaxID=3347114 RepID=UPI00365188CC